MSAIILEDADWREEKVSSSGVISLHVLCPEEEEILVSLVRFENWKESVLFHNFQSWVNEDRILSKRRIIKEAVVETSFELRTAVKGHIYLDRLYLKPLWLINEFV